MSGHGDHSDEMTPAGMLDDEAVEAFLSGTADGGWQRDEALARLADDVAVATSGPPPAPGAALREFMGGRSSRPSTEPRRGDPAPLATWTPRPVAWAPRPVPTATAGRPSASARWAVRAAAAAVTALTGVSAAAAAGVLPDPAQRVVANAVEAVTPFELPEAAPGRAGAAPVPPTTVPVAAGAPTVGSDPPPVVPPSAAGGSEPSVPAAPAPPPEQPAPAPAPAPAGPTTGIGGSWTCQTTPGAAQSGTWGGSTTNQRSTWPSGGYGDRSNLWGTSGTAQCWSFGDWDSWWESNEGGGSGLRSSKRGWALARPDR